MKKQMCIKIEETLLPLIDETAKDLFTTKTEVVTRAIVEFLERRKAATQGLALMSAEDTAEMLKKSVETDPSKPTALEQIFANAEKK